MDLVGDNMAEDTMTLEQMTAIMKSYRLLCEDKDKEIMSLRKQLESLKSRLDKATSGGVAVLEWEA